MIYSTSDKLEQYLSHYNISSVTASKDTQVCKFILKNLHTNLNYNLEIDKPLYNILGKDAIPFTFPDLLFDDILVNRTLKYKNIMFDSDITSNQFYDNFINKDYYKKFGVIEHEPNLKWSSEHFSYMEMKDIEKIKELTGFLDKTILQVCGNFIKLSDNTLRFIFNPTTPILENVNEVFFAHSYIFTINGFQYPMYYIIYTTTLSNDVMFEQSNLLVNNITNCGLVTVNLSQLFNDKQPTIYTDMKNLIGYNSEQFIVNNLFTCTIFKNTNNGILRFVPITYNQNFFNIVFNKMNLKYSATQRHVPPYSETWDYHFNYNGSDFENLNKHVSTDEKISVIYKEQKIVPWTEMAHSEFLNQLLKLSSTAEYYNDVLFSLEESFFQFPIYLINETDTVIENKPYGTQENVDIIIK